VASGGEGLSPVEGDGVVVLALVRVVADALLGETEAAMTQFDGRGGLCRFNGREHFLHPIWFSGGSPMQNFMLPLDSEGAAGV
jgi:hypothetical protein